MRRGLQGAWHTSRSGGETVRAYVPAPLPPTPSIDWSDPRLRPAMDAALLALGGLRTVTTVLPDSALFLYSYVRKEAVLSSLIEGTQSSLSDLLLHEMGEAPGVPLDDVTEVSRYVAALERGMELLSGGLPLSVRLIKAVHAELLHDGRGSRLLPGEFRTSQNWIGGTRPGNAVFVPPPAADVVPCMSDLEKYLNDDAALSSPLVQAALAHVQFETIHPFLDGNGRVGRLLIALILCSTGVLTQPMLYLSLFLKKHRTEYYRLLDLVRYEGAWEEWLLFFAEAVTVTSYQAVDTVRRLSDVMARDRAAIIGMGRSSRSAGLVHGALCERPVANARVLAERTGLSTPTVNAAARILAEHGIAREITGARRGKIYAYGEYMSILNEGTDLP